MNNFSFLLDILCLSSSMINFHFGMVAQILFSAFICVIRTMLLLHPFLFLSLLVPLFLSLGQQASDHILSILSLNKVKRIFLLLHS